MPVFLVGMLGFCGFVIFIGIPIGIVIKAWQNRKKGDGSYAMAIIIDKTCTNARIEMLPKDRNYITDTIEIVEKGKKVKKERTYTVKAGYCPNVMWPPFQSKILQASVPMTLLTEGVSPCVDPVGKNRDGALETYDNADLVAAARNEKMTDSMTKNTDLINELLERIEKGQKGLSPVLFFLGIGIVIIALVIVVMMLKGQISGQNEMLQSLSDALKGITPPVTP